MLGTERSAARRTRTRLPFEERRQQLLDLAAAIALERGVHDVTLKRVAREAGISETQAHNLFAGRIDLLVALARREVAAVEARRRERVERGRDALTSVVMSTISYLHQAADRGPLLQRLLRSADVRDALRGERTRASEVARAPILASLARGGEMSRESANASTAALTAVCLRAGGLIAAGRCDFEAAERLCLSVVMSGTLSNRRVARAAH
jgi:AcrR family transcriptional regulator